MKDLTEHYEEALEKAAAEIEQLREQRASLQKEVAAYRMALDKSVELQIHYAKLLNMYDGGKRIEFADSDAWLKRLDTHGQPTCGEKTI